MSWCTWCIDWFIDVTPTFVRSVVELSTLMFAETQRAIRTLVDVTDAISLAFSQAVTTAVRRPASAIKSNQIKFIFQ